MDPLSIFAAALATFVLGSLWYMAFADHWKVAARLPLNAEGDPQSGMSLKVFASSFVLLLIVATALQVLFLRTGVTSIVQGAATGAGVGLLFITPWIGINNLYAIRSPILTLIDGGYATLACTLMGVILTLL
ncbi:DUF1761 domain-containing protein [Falsiruegeria mediterranea]|jgi:Protein of unknown function (DUF1761)|uniref:DUF1761 domain-containing protein n=1 Tax=Falsiruegeria mediterranea M17 TaxID=1200281 RepID=A0A2R8C3G9_9RHOB|nr:DUF1761 domain-containing protein [Falsiruegeria mediterranea]SPJ26978.1 hypothetical protein TRM7615_00457 [Falsiruegeria mediterranea M17]